MGIERRGGHHIFSCDVCDHRRSEEIAQNWDLSRLAFVTAEEDGWQFEKLRGKWVALCPVHADQGEKTF
ncbi:hypothetical protein [Bradyrhizobium sp. AUGA SZCCT0160]|uniref:hypothetical protein n=1 Tax=Bradyrhizobium sp. AUGA SZCCT0160 TaxID=2807662 RepID=UPI001BA9E53E|nr:hypothetical protein [Bradyrhizobium sp. AUGA SZCCT0160]MBR1188010.1 hypothetical protein [Bradyrhizobium sp. AUGA SZCCT0160]MBR1188255.1 hypothetical protein [Bradyrhizobium sp. AUGA SZCCT0160]